ncbi:MAG: hypothetical protein KF784_10415 [Fimbriimonadaceae bacterium]|nr:hypothetical protein [Fimbriimonadaceae bacterium]
MAEECVIGEIAVQRRVLKIGTIVKWILPLPPAIILLSFCTACTQPGPFQYFKAVLLPLIGFTVALSLNFLRGLWSDCIVVLGSVTGVLLLSTGYLLGVQPCLMCLTFWFLWGVLLLEVILENRKLARIGSVAILTATFCVVALSMSPFVRASARTIASNNFIEAEGLRVGAALPETGIIGQNAVAIFSAKCPTCWSGRMEKIIGQLRQKYQQYPLQVFVLDGADDPVWANKTVIRHADPEFFSMFNVRTAGIPYIMIFENGKVSESFDASSEGEGK